MTSRVVAVVVLCVIAVSGTAAAQGKGVGRGKGGQTTPAPVVRGGAATSTTPVALQPSPSFPEFGTWLDDATTSARGVGFAALGATYYWRGSAAEQINAPVIGVTYGIANRAQLSGTIPFYRARSEGFSTSGLDAVFISSKVAIIDPDAGAQRVGLAVGAVAEIFGAGFAEGSRVHLAVPLSAEVLAHPFRVYGSTGNFTRGVFFAAGALEVTAPRGTSLTASFAHSASVKSVRGVWRSRSYASRSVIGAGIRASSRQGSVEGIVKRWSQCSQENQ